MFTKCETEPIYKWHIDWTQFDNARLLNQVEASFEVCSGEFEDYEYIKEFDWNTGTIIILSPVRELWDRKLYIKVNNNLKNIKPFGRVDRFDIVVKNQKYPDLNYETQSEGISRENYDYQIEAVYDGKDCVTFTVDRNEIDMMMVLDSAGVMAQTFSHEITRIGTEPDFVDADKVYKKKDFYKIEGEYSKEKVFNIFDSMRKYVGQRDKLQLTIDDLKQQLAKGSLRHEEVVGNMLALERQLDDFVPAEQSQIDKVFDEQKAKEIVALTEKANALLE